MAHLVYRFLLDIARHW